MNRFNALHGDEPTNPQRYWNSKLPEDQFKYRTYSPKTSPVVSAILGRLNHCAIDNDGV